MDTRSLYIYLEMNVVTDLSTYLPIDIDIFESQGLDVSSYVGSNYHALSEDSVHELVESGESLERIFDLNIVTRDSKEGIFEGMPVTYQLTEYSNDLGNVQIKAVSILMKTPTKEIHDLVTYYWEPSFEESNLLYLSYLQLGNQFYKKS